MHSTEHPKRVSPQYQGFSSFEAHRGADWQYISSVYYNVKGIVGNHWSTWLSDCAANAETLLLQQLHARYRGASIYAGGRERFAIPHKIRGSNAPVEPHRASAAIFSQRGENHATIRPWWPRWATGSAQRRRLIPHIPAHWGAKTSTFAGHLATFHARIFTWRAAVDVESRFAFPGWYCVVGVGPSARSGLVASLFNWRKVAEKKRLQKLKQPDRLYARSRLGRARVARSRSPPCASIKLFRCAWEDRFV